MFTAVWSRPLRSTPMETPESDLRERLQRLLRISDHFDGYIRALSCDASATKPILEAGISRTALNTKFEDVHKHLHEAWTKAEWIQHQKERLEEGFSFLPGSPVDPDQIIKDIRDALLKIDQPHPTRRYIVDDLEAMKRLLDADFDTAMILGEQLWQEAWDAYIAMHVARRLGKPSDPAAEVGLLADALEASALYIKIALKPAELLRQTLETCLATVDRPPSVPLPALPLPSPVTTTTAPDPVASPPVPSQYEFRLDGGVWVVRFEDERGQFTDSKGFRRIARLLADQGRTVFALELDGSDALSSASRSVRRPDEFEEGEGDADGCSVAPCGDSALPTFDREALGAIYSKRAELRAKIDQAGADNNFAIQQELQEEVDKLDAQLKREVGLGGKARSIQNDAGKKAADAVRNSINRVYTNLSNAKPPLKRLTKHLKKNIQQSGSTLCYNPQPPMEWCLQ